MIEATYLCTRCSLDGSIAKIGVTGPTVAACERAVKEAGWAKDRHRWVCPACSKGRPTPSDAKRTKN